MTKVFLFIVSYKRELKIGADIKKKEKVEQVIEFIKRIRKIQEETGATLRKVQKKMKQQVNKRRREAEKWREEG